MRLALTALVSLATWGCGCGETAEDPGAAGGSGGGSGGSAGDAAGGSAGSAGTAGAGGQPPDGGPTDAGADSDADASDAGDELLAPACETAPATYASARGICEADDWCWENPLPGMAARAVWGASDDDVWVVHESGVAHWDGSSWTTTSDRAGTDVWGSAANDVWIVDPKASKLHHFDGTTWTSTPTPSAVSKIHGSSASNVWVIGEAPAQAGRFDGTSWNWIAGPSLLQLQRVQTTGPSDVWALGAELERFDGSTWQTVQALSGSETAVWAAAANDVWIAGYDSATSAGALVRWNGTAFVPLSSPSQSTLHALAGANVDDVWALSSLNDTHHWSGSSWATVPSEAPKLSSGLGLAGATPWITTQSGPVARWTGSEWSAPGIGTMDFYDAWGSAWNDLWVVGNGGTVAHFDGTAWTTTIVGEASQDLRAIWGSGPNDIWVGSSGGALHHFDGSTWWTSGYDLPSITDLGGAAGELWVTSHEGKVYRTDGKTTIQTFQLPVAAWGVWVGAPDEIWVAGHNQMFRFDGTSFTPRSVGFQARGVWGRRRSEVWAFGYDQIHRWDGASWTSFTSPVGEVRDMWGCGESELWIAAHHGLSRFSPASGAFEPSGPQVDLCCGGQVSAEGLAAVWGAGPSHVVAAGNQGAILRRAK